MGLTDVLNLLGGLALFLFGMNLMGEALEKRAGNRLKNILGRLTSSPARGFLLGLGVTAVIQSSSATTVMVVGFVNSGVMKLEQTVGIIMGANVGTAVTAWILSLAGITGDAWYLTIFKPATFTPVMAAVGIGFNMFSKRQKRKDTGMILLGFSVLMFGMETMSGAVAPLKDMPDFANIFLMFSNPILGVLAGTVLTAIVQSSSASVGILQALSMTGAITYGSAIPIIMGQNIGTCITALLSSLGTSRDAKRAAMIHLYFNVIGMVVWLSIFCLVQALVPLQFVSEAASPLGIAFAHTAFKLLSTALLMPFGKQLEKLAYISVPNGKGDREAELLDERLFVTPVVAIEQADSVARTMAKTSWETLKNAIQSLRVYDEKTAEAVRQGETRVDWLEDHLGTYLVKLSTMSLSEASSREVTEMLHLIGDFERISDHALNILESAEELHEKELAFTPKARQELSIMINAVEEILDLAMRAFDQTDLEAAAQVEPLEQTIDVLKSMLKARHIERLTKGECTIELGFVLTDLLTNFERISDHCSNIAVCVLETAHGSFDMHEYLSRVKANSSEFQQRLVGYLKKYTLPEA